MEQLSKNIKKPKCTSRKYAPDQLKAKTRDYWRISASYEP